MYMVEGSPSPRTDLNISKSLIPLRDVVASFNKASRGDVPFGAERQRLLRRLRKAGNSAVPALIRGLASASEAEASWAYFLLSRLGGDRVVRRVGELLSDPSAGDEVKARALGLLSELKAPVPREVVLTDPDALLKRSVAELLESLKDNVELTEAVGLILEQVPEPEVPAFAAELLRHGGDRAAALIDLLLERGQLSEDIAREVAGMRREADSDGPSTEAPMLGSLDRGLEYLEAGRPNAAKRHLERFVAAYPDRAEGLSALGVCLLELGRLDRALGLLHRASELEPEEPLHHWNVASACKQSERMGGCYLALRAYLEREDSGEDAPARREEARSFVRAYERMLRASQPGAALSDVLRAEGLFARAHAALSEGRYAAAAESLEAVLELSPSHYPSWAHLGAAYLGLQRRDDAEHCLKRALELNPEYAIARQNMAILRDLHLQP
jgi:Flp pilus assembly protein TadD